MPALQRRMSRRGRVVRRVVAAVATEERLARSQGRKVMGRLGASAWTLAMVDAAEVALRPVKISWEGLWRASSMMVAAPTPAVPVTRELVSI